MAFHREGTDDGMEPCWLRGLVHVPESLKVKHIRREKGKWALQAKRMTRTRDGEGTGHWGL